MILTTFPRSYAVGSPSFHQSQVEGLLTSIGLGLRLVGEGEVEGEGEGEGNSGR